MAQIIGNRASYEGPLPPDAERDELGTLPRCPATPSDDEADRWGVGARDFAWGCALPAGHEEFELERHQPHAWTRVAEVSRGR